MADKTCAFCGDKRKAIPKRIERIMGGRWICENARACAQRRRVALRSLKQHVLTALLAWYFISAGSQYGPFKSQAECERIRAWSQATVKSQCWEG